MRFFELLNEVELSSEEVRKKLISAVNSADRPLLDKMYYVLDSGDFDTRIESVLSSDVDAAKIKNYIARVFATTKGTASEKKEFLDNFQNGFIDTETLLSASSSINSWFTGNPFSKAVFSEVCLKTERGIGPAELALAAFSPELKGTGSAAGSGDLIYGKQSIEVKGRISSWGRLHDAKKMGYDLPSIARKFKEAGIDQPVLTVVQWLDIRSNIDHNIVLDLCKTTVDNLFTKVSSSEKNRLIGLLVNGSLGNIKAEWGRLSFINYKNAVNFTGILFFDIPTGATKFITDSNSSQFKTEAPQMYGPEQQAMPKVSPI